MTAPIQERVWFEQLPDLAEPVYAFDANTEIVRLGLGSDPYAHLEPRVWTFQTDRFDAPGQISLTKIKIPVVNSALGFLLQFTHDKAQDPCVVSQRLRATRPPILKAAAARLALDQLVTDAIKWYSQEDSDSLLWIVHRPPNQAGTSMVCFTMLKNLAEGVGNTTSPPEKWGLTRDLLISLGDRSPPQAPVGTVGDD